MKKRTYYFDLLRILACFLVVQVHVSGESFNAYPLNTFHWSISNLYNCLSIVGVPIFFMLSGALLLHQKSAVSPKNFFLKKALPLIITFFITVFAYNVIHFMILVPEKSFEAFKNIVLLTTLSGTGYGTGHLWFLPMLFVIYLLVPILQSGLSEEKNCKYFLVLFFIVGIVWDSALLFYFPYYSILDGIRQAIPFQLLATYTGYFVLGHYLHSFTLPKLLEKNKTRQDYWKAGSMFTAMFGLSITCAANSFFSKQSQLAVSKANTPFFIGHFLSSIGLFLLFGLLFTKKKDTLSQEKLNKLITYLSKNTLLIYLVHPAILILIKECTAIPLRYGLPILDIPLVTLIIFLISLGIASFCNLSKDFFYQKRKN